MIKKAYLNIVTLCAGYLIATIAQAQHKVGVGFGAVAKNMLEPVSLLADFVHTACFVIGGSFLFACLIKYIEHKRSPLMVPISTVVFLLVAGLLLIALPFISYMTESGVHYTLMK